MISESAESKYSCFFCEKELIPYFYVCSRIHVFCSSCTKMGGFCPVCHTIRILCCELSVYESSPKGPIFQKAGGYGPVISLTEGGDEFYTSTRIDNHPHTRMLKCLDCSKLISGGMVREHYSREHTDIPICPVTLGGCLSFRLRSSDVPCNWIRRLQIVQLVSQRQLFSRFECNVQNKIFFIVATKVTFLRKKASILLWLTSHDLGQPVMYSIEARSGNDNVAATIFTGLTVGPIEMADIINGKKKPEDLGKYLAIQDSLMKELETKGGGVIINTLILDVI